MKALEKRLDLLETKAAVKSDGRCSRKVTLETDWLGFPLNAPPPSPEGYPKSGCDWLGWPFQLPAK